MRLQVASYAINDLPNTLITTLCRHGIEGLVKVTYPGGVAYGVAMGYTIILKGGHHPGGLIEVHEIEELP